MTGRKRFDELMNNYHVSITTNELEDKILHPPSSGECAICGFREPGPTTPAEDFDSLMDGPEMMPNEGARAPLDRPEKPV